MLLAITSDLLWIQVARKNLVGYYAKVRTAEWYRHTPQQLKQVEWA